jgi:hypothetical protein
MIRRCGPARGRRRHAEHDGSGPPRLGGILPADPHPTSLREATFSHEWEKDALGRRGRNNRRGLLRLYGDDETGWHSVAEAWLRPDGIFAETETGLPVARMVNGSLVFDADSLPKAKAEAGTRSERDEPKLCPDPGPDVPHGASERAIVYQEQISRLNNPQRPLLAGMAVSLAALIHGA